MMSPVTASGLQPRQFQVCFFTLMEKRSDIAPDRSAVDILGKPLMLGVRKRMIAERRWTCTPTRSRASTSASAR